MSAAAAEGTANDAGGSGSWEESAASWLPDTLVRRAIRGRLGAVLADVGASQWERDVEGAQAAKSAYVAGLRKMGIVAPLSEAAANKQHYEVPTEFFQLVMGRCMKYSCCLYENGATPATISLDEAEEAMLDKVCERAGLHELEGTDNPVVLDLGCGWGSFTLYAARKFPNITFVALSNSSTQREFILSRAEEDGTASRVSVVTANIAEFKGDDSSAGADGTDANFLSRFDRIVSNEMFEHMKNYQLLLAKLSGWLKTGGKMFVHHFSHRTTAYDFQDGDWMTDNFFSGGTMPSHDLLCYFQDDLQVIDHWAVSGKHYEHTSNHWLINMDKVENRSKVAQIMGDTYGKENVALWTTRWRLFFLACAELFGYNNGNEWIVTHVLFGKQAR